MIWTFIILLFIAIIGKFFWDFSKDNDDLKNQQLHEKFGVIVELINLEAFDGLGTISKLDKREFNLYQDMQNQIIKFQYSTGNLTITWRYKYFQKEVVHERQFNDVRNLSLFEQKRLAEQLIKEMNNIIYEHKINVLNDT